MRIFCFLLLSFSVLVAHAQKQVTINGNISGLAEGSRVYLVPNEANITWRDSTMVKGGRFQFKITIPEALSYSVRLSRGFQEGKWQTFYLDEGVLSIQGQNGTFKGMRLSGSQFVTDYDNFRKWMYPHNIEGRLVEVDQQHAQAVNVKDTLLQNKLVKEYYALDTLRAKLTSQWVKKHHSSSIGPYLLYTIVRGSLSTTDLEVVLNEVNPAAKKDFFAKRLQAHIDAAKATAIGKLAPNFSQADTSGNPVFLQNFEGKYVLLDFWASWCVPCRAENPNVLAAFKEYQNKGFTVLSVSLDNNKEKWLHAIATDNMPWTHISDLKYWSNAVAVLYDVHSIPSNLLLDPDGKILAKDLRGDELTTTIARFLGVPSQQTTDTKSNKQQLPPPPPTGL